jgi:diguanylate cyclase (GGDEF)-like protein/PAS domain S-box-containing protein
MGRDDGFYKAILDNLYDGVYFVDRDRRITYWNRGAERITGYEGAAVLGRCCAENLLMHVDASGAELCQAGCPLSAAMGDGGIREAQVFLHHASGHRVPVSVRVAPLRDADGTIVGAVEVFSENSAVVTALERLQELRREVEEDALTGVGSRRYAEIRLQSAIADCARHGERSGVLFLDVDHFKQVNDTYGHDTGDRVLRMVADTLRVNVRSTDSVGRWGGEEFIVLLPGVESQALSTIAEKLRTLVSHSWVAVREGRLAVTVSVGGTVTRPSDTLESLLRRVDDLLYRSKAAGRDRVTVAD